MKNDSLNRFDRTVAILIHLQAGRVVKAQELAERFGVSLRTVYRDIRSLEAAGVPISGESGVGYSLMEGYRLPPVMFTREEASSFVAAEKLMQKFTDKTLGAHHESAMFKVKSVLRGHAKDRIAALEAQVWINSAEKLFHENTPDALDVLLDSMAEKTQVTLQYQSLSSDEPTRRVIEPIGLFNENNFWYVMGFCHLRHDYRQFRTDRMLHIKRTTTPFTREHGSLDEYREAAAMPPGNSKVVIRVPQAMVRHLRSGRKFYGFVAERTMGDYVEMTFLTCENWDGLPRWFLMFGDCAEIVEPESFRERVRVLLEKTRRNLEPKKELA